MKFLSLFAIVGAAAAYNLVPADGIYLFVENYDEAADAALKRQESMKRQILEQQGSKKVVRQLNPFDGLYHMKDGVYDTQGNKVNDEPISM